MSTLLKINASLFSANGQSSQLAERFAAAWQASHPGSRIVERDLAANPVPHLDGARFMAFLAKPEERSAEQQTVVDFSDALIAELRAADVIVIGAPMYNFSVPTTLRSWFDHVLRAGETFRYSEAGPEGLLTGKKVIVVESRGGLYSEGPGQALDFQEPYLRQLLGFVGLTDVTFIRAEKIGYGPEARDQAVADSRAELARLPA